MKLASWNVNGLRAVERAGFLDWFAKENADVVCLQEIKAFREQVSMFLWNPLGFHSFWHPAQKPGYSGVVTYCRHEPIRIQEGIGIEAIDAEGRVLVTEFREFTLINAYFPNSQRDHARLGYKLDFCRHILEFCQKLRNEGKHVVLCGDFNIAHRAIDLRNPKTNENNAGFLPEERSWLDQFEGAGYTDAFRHFEKGPGHYSWWSYRPGVREKNIGWRLDYHWLNKEFEERLLDARLQPKVLGSDHCPAILELNCSA